MAQRYLFFNSGVNDPRIYQAADFAKYFGTVLSTGLLHTNKVPSMQVYVEPGTLQTYVTAGGAIMKGHLYENTTAEYFAHSVPEPDLDRIDRIVLRLDLRNAERNILLHLKEGVSSADPVPPELQRDNFIYEISLAQIRIRANTSSLNPADLIDERLNEQLCGLVSSLISIPTNQFQEQWDLFFTAKSAELQQATDDYESYSLEEQQRLLEATNEFVQAVIVAEQQLQADLASFNQQWIDWFSNQQTEGFVMADEKGAPGGVAKQDDFIAHVADDVRHTTQQEKNAWNAKVDSTEKAQPNGIATLGTDGLIPDNQVPKSFVLGSYVGDGTARRFINIGFTPSRVEVVTLQGTSVRTLFAFSDQSFYFYVGSSTTSASTTPTISITNGGFLVDYNTGNADANRNGYVFKYIAYK